MAKPKLALIPAAQGSKFYSVLPSSGVGDFDFTRSGSATRINSQGLIETVGNGVSRLNYPMIDGKVVGCPHHILEPQRTNYLTNSDNGSSYTVFSATKTLDEQISPDGTLKSFTLTGNGDYNQILGETPFVTLPSAGDYTFSVFAKKGTHSKVQLFLNGFNSSSNNEAYFDLENNSTPSSNGKIENYGNGWYRLSFVSTVDATDLYGRIGFRVSYTTSTFFFPTANDAIGKNLYFYGFQLEQGSYPTSYIPTNGSSVTRSAETANGSGDADTFNNSEGVFMAEISSLTNNNPLFNSLSIASGTTNVLSIGFSDGLNELYVFKTNGSSSWFKEVLVNDITNFNKIALSYESNDNQFWINGFKIETNNSIGIHPSAMSDMDFNAAVGNEFMYSNTKQIQYYDSALTDSELETLTSWVSFSDMANGQLYTIE
jgi:hypothetical protein